MPLLYGMLFACSLLLFELYLGTAFLLVICFISVVALLACLFLFSMRSADAQGLLYVVKSYKFVSTLYAMNDVLPIFERLSKTFQHDNLSFSSVNPVVTTTYHSLDDLIKKDENWHCFHNLKSDLRESLKGLIEPHSKEEEKEMMHQRQQLATSLRDHVRTIFSEDDLKTINAFAALFDPAVILSHRGAIDMNNIKLRQYFSFLESKLSSFPAFDKCCDDPNCKQSHFQHVKERYPAFFDLWRAVCQNHCKTHVDEHGAVSSCPSFEEVATQVLNQPQHVLAPYRHLLVLVRIAMAMSWTQVHCERGFCFF